jgi:hypothetical protein
VTNSPHCIISWATPTLRRNVDLPPEVALLAVTRDRRHDLVQVQVPCEGAILAVLPGVPGRQPSGGQQSRAPGCPLRHEHVLPHSGL